jgi:hypothetical protein
MNILRVFAVKILDSKGAFEYTKAQITEYIPI